MTADNPEPDTEARKHSHLCTINDHLWRHGDWECEHGIHARQATCPAHDHDAGPDLDLRAKLSAALEAHTATLEAYSALKLKYEQLERAKAQAERERDEARNALHEHIMRHRTADAHDCAEMEELLASSRALVRTLVEALQHAENHCPCGARPETPNTHPHVIGCPIERALRQAQDGGR